MTQTSSLWHLSHAIVQPGQHEAALNGWAPLHHRVLHCIGCPQASNTVLAAPTGSPCCSLSSGIWLAKRQAELRYCTGALATVEC